MIRFYSYLDLDVFRTQQIQLSNEISAIYTETFVSKFLRTENISIRQTEKTNTIIIAFVRAHLDL